MLIQFNFKNFKSFKDETTLDMTATSIKEHSYNLIESAYGDKLLRTAAIYGANASGKSNVIEAFQFMRHYIINSFDVESKDNKIPIKRFLFDSYSRNDTAEFEVFFTFKNIEYQYGLVVDDIRVHQEWLYGKYKTSRGYETLFERKGSHIEIGERIKEAENIKDLVEESTLFLSFAAKTKIWEVKQVFSWFVLTDIINYGNAFLETFMYIDIPGDKFNDENYRKRYEDFLSAVDTGISGIRVEEIKQTTNHEGKTIYKVFSKHKLNDKDEFVEIPFAEESSGTQKLFYLFDYFMDTLKYGSTLFIDELDAKLHPLLLRYIVNMFHDKEINKNNAQLIYTTHDIYTLTKDTFRRDEIWFVDKDTNGVSKLYSLAEYKLDDDKKVRNDASYNKEYLLGRYGAVPLLKEFNLMEDK